MAGPGTTGRRDAEIVVRGASEHNLESIDVSMPRDRLVVVTGVSGSGKSSLAFDTLYREGQRRFLETMPSYARSFMGGMVRPRATSIDGLGPAIAVGQRVGASNPRSTVGTITEVWDLLRLLFARLGTSASGVKPTRALFSFNGPEGACPACQGLGLEDRLDPEAIVADPARSIRDGALRVSTPNGYLMYSQVTLAVLDDVLREHGGSVDVPWRDLCEEARTVVFDGSQRIKVPFGKHPLESRLRWKGITPRPRQEGYYRGLIPIMEEILRGKRNDSILRFVRTTPCTACSGARLRPEALSVRFGGSSIADVARMRPVELRAWLSGAGAAGRDEAVLSRIREDLVARCGLMIDLGLGHLRFERSAPTLSAGEAQRLRLLTLALGDLSGLVVVLDEPSAGLHPHDTRQLLAVLERLRDKGQTVVVVEHDPVVACSADWLVDLGPGPGRLGGKLLFSGPPSGLAVAPSGGDASPTRAMLSGARSQRARRPCVELVPLSGLRRNNLEGVRCEIARECLNLVTGVSGAGKTSLLDAAVELLKDDPGAGFRRIVAVDAGPIGRTPRSNPATYSEAFDSIRDLFASTPEAAALGLTKGHFSFNLRGGRCEACEGAGSIEIGMRYLGTASMVCESCGGRRFHPDVLAVLYRGRSVADVLESSIDEARDLFADHVRLRRILGALVDMGLGYVSVGQPATTLSGGEAQRVKLATELAKAPRGASLIVLDEPSTGLHAADVAVVLAAWDRLLDAGHTLLVADNDLELIRVADRIIDVGPGGGPDGGRIVFQGGPGDLASCGESLTGECLRMEARPGADDVPQPRIDRRTGQPPMSLEGVRTNNLAGFDIEIPSRGLTVVTGPSGCGKSSLVFDTLLAEARMRFADLVAPWARRFLPRQGSADLDAARSLQAAVAVPHRAGRRNPRSTVGTISGIDELLRMIFSRAGVRPCPSCGQPVTAAIATCACGGRLPAVWAGSLSPNTEAGACVACRGLGFVQRCDQDLLVSHPGRPLHGGAMDGTRYGAYLGEADGQYMAILAAAASSLGLDVSHPWDALGEPARVLAMDGAGDRVFDVVWKYRRGKRGGEHRFESAWKGLRALVEIEHDRVHADRRGESLERIMRDVTCPECKGDRLRPESRSVTFAGMTMPGIMRRSMDGIRSWLEAVARDPEREGVSARAVAAHAGLLEDVSRRMGALADAGLGYLSPGREVASLSGGEIQRLRLASALGGGLVGVTYVLDEPTQGLHPREVQRLSGVLRALADAGNAVVVVEHDAAIVAQADRVIELGPGSGPEGGRVIAQGAPRDLPAGCRTARLLGGRRAAAARLSRTLPPGVTVRGASLHNLKGLDVSFPAAALVSVTGVSGSGKSTLVHEILGPSIEDALAGKTPRSCSELVLHADLSRVESLCQDLPVGAGQSTVATLSGVSDAIRRRFAETDEARSRGLTAGHFSTASAGGRCEECEGRGVVTIAMDLLPDVTVGCEACGGRRFRPEVLGCVIDGRSIADVLADPMVRIADLFEADPAVRGPLDALAGIGLGYLRLGQEASSLSAGEMQRMRLAGLIAEAGSKPVAILLDEPTRGLGFEDVEALLASLHRLADAGHMVVVVEHDLDVISASDWVIDLGPEGGDGGGRLVAEGTPAAVRAAAGSHTGRALAEMFARGGERRC